MVDAHHNDLATCVGFTGTQKGMKVPQIFRVTHLMKWLREEMGFLCLHHGDCIGADVEADHLWHGLGGVVFIHPPIDPKKRAFCKVQDYDAIGPMKDYIPRNHDIVDDSYRMIVAPNNMTEMKRGSGTWATFRYAMELKRPTHLVFPTGEVQNFNV